MSRAGAILLVFLVCGAVVEADVVKPYPINFTIPVRNVVTNVNATKMADYIEKKIK
uniref:Secreted protein n=2 Tax=Bursaphelenchus xylophilus TaxID=6326 RepID=A0A1I7SJQ1_BURXY